MTKTELIKATATKAEKTIKETGEIVTALQEVIMETLKAGEDVRVPGFGSLAIEVTTSGENQETATFTVPEDAKSGDTIHIIMEGVDGGGTNPVAYQRVIVTVK